MTRRGVDVERLRAELRKLSRGNLLLVAERAIELPLDEEVLRGLVGDLVQLEDAAKVKRGGTASLLGEVRAFHEASLRGDYFESFNVNSKNFTSKSKGTDAFMVEFDRLLNRSIRAAAEAPRAPVREAFDLLFALLRRLDEDPDGVVFFADEGGAWQVGVDWRAAFPAWFGCLADGASGEEFAREADRAIADFADHDRPRYLAAARRVANAEQKAALRRLPARGKGR